MNSKRAKIIVLAVFVLTLGAGMTAGILAARLPAASVAPATTPVSADESSLISQLGLTSEQSGKMQKIWEGVRDISVESLSKGVSAQGARDDAIRALIPPDKIEAYNKVQRNYAETMASMEGRRKSAFNHAVKLTEEILTESQRKKYQEILSKRLGAEDVTGHDPLNEPAAGRPDSQPSI